MEDAGSGARTLPSSRPRFRWTLGFSWASGTMRPGTAPERVSELGILAEAVRIEIANVTVDL